MDRTRRLLALLLTFVLLLTSVSVSVFALDLPPVDVEDEEKEDLDPEQENRYHYISFDRRITVVGLKETLSGEVTLPATLGGYPIVAIAEGAFSNAAQITALTLPDTVEMLGKNSFSGCTSLVSVSLGSELELISDGAFSGCTELTSVSLPEGVKTLGKEVFKGCASLENITFPEKMHNIGFGSLEGTPYLAALEDGPVYAGKALLLYKGTAPAEVELKEGTVSVTEKAFAGQTALESIAFPPSLSTIGKGAFLNCSALSSVEIPENLSFLSYDTFRGCSSLATLSVSPENRLFEASHGCLVNVDTEELILATDKAAPPSDLYYTSIGDRVFQGHTDLENIVIPHEVISIGEEAFQGCTSLVSVSLSEDVKIIEKNAFQGCNALKEVHYGGYRYQIKEISVKEEGNESLLTAPWYCNFKGRGDVNEDGAIDQKDVEYLLYHTLFGNSRYPFFRDADFDLSGTVTSEDVLYLLYSLTFGAERYPL